MLLKDRTAVVTGGARGLGRHIVTALMAEGARVVCAGRSPGDGPWPEGATPDFREVDVRDAGSVAALMEWAADRLGGIDVVVANAGAARPGPVDRLGGEDWATVFDTNVTGTFHCLRAAVPYLEKSSAGRIITLSSVLATRAAPGASAYCASKAAVEMLTRVAALELAPRGITVNALAPGFVDAGMGRQLAANEAVWSRYEPKLAMGRLGTPDEAARAAVFLAGPDSSYVNGHVLEVSGGLLW
jgi:3-oxoacyl-[acyl-carrier protein] reductase